MTEITEQDWQDYCDGKGEERERPADPDDFRFEIMRNPEPDDNAHLYLVKQIDDKGVVVDSFYSEDGYAYVEAFRESQEYTLEERLGPYGLEWQREQEERRGGW